MAIKMGRNTKGALKSEKFNCAKNNDEVKNHIT